MPIVNPEMEPSKPSFRIKQLDGALMEVESFTSIPHIISLK